MAKKSGATIQFHYLCKAFHFPQRQRLKKFIVGLFNTEGFDIEHINFIFCTDRYLHQINMQFLEHDTYTDTITFPFSAKGKPILSDIYISVDRVRENAELFGRPFLEELYRVIFHGSLHLTGFRDKTLTQKNAMRDR